LPEAITKPTLFYFDAFLLDAVPFFGAMTTGVICLEKNVSKFTYSAFIRAIANETSTALKNVY